MATTAKYRAFSIILVATRILDSTIPSFQMISSSVSHETIGILEVDCSLGTRPS